MVIGINSLFSLIISKVIYSLVHLADTFNHLPVTTSWQNYYCLHDIWKY